MGRVGKGHWEGGGRGGMSCPFMLRIADFSETRSNVEVVCLGEGADSVVGHVGGVTG